MLERIKNAPPIDVSGDLLEILKRAEAKKKEEKAKDAAGGKDAKGGKAAPKKKK